MLLCSDDKLHKNAVADLVDLRSKWPEASLILSTFDSINSDGTARPPDSSSHHEELRTSTGLVEPEQMLPALLRLGKPQRQPYGNGLQQESVGERRRI